MPPKGKEPGPLRAPLALPTGRTPSSSSSNVLAPATASPTSSGINNSSLPPTTTPSRLVANPLTGRLTPAARRPSTPMQSNETLLPHVPGTGGAIGSRPAASLRPLRAPTPANGGSTAASPASGATTKNGGEGSEKLQSTGGAPPRPRMTSTSGSISPAAPQHPSPYPPFPRKTTPLLPPLTQGKPTPAPPSTTAGKTAAGGSAAPAPVFLLPDAAEVSLSIASVETPPGVDEWSSSSSSAEFNHTANSNAMAGRVQSLVTRNSPGSGVKKQSDENFDNDETDDNLTPVLLPLAGPPLRSYEGHEIYDEFDLRSDVGGGLHLGTDDEDEDGAADRAAYGQGGGGGSGNGSGRGGGGHVGPGFPSGMGSGFRSSPGITDDTSHGGLVNFFNKPKECHNCQSSAVGYTCEQCTSFFLCENCRFDEAVLDAHPKMHRIIPLHETHCSSSRTFGGSTSLATLDGASSLFYDPCSSCRKAIEDWEPVYRCDTCDFIVCESCHNKQTIEHKHELRRFQRKARNGSVTEGTLFNKSRTNDGNKVINDYVVVRLLGQGSFAKVKLVQNIRTRKPYALKILRKTRRSQSNLLLRQRVRQSDDDLLREIAVMKFVDHPNIVKLIEVIDDVEGSKVYMIMEYCAKGPVHVLGDPVLPLSQVRAHGVGILGGLLHMHSEFLYHRDVKPANCLVDDHDVVKIADFGTCSSRVRSAVTDGTPAFSCPEQVRNEEVSGDVTDSWAFALTLYQMAYGILPCDDMGALQYREMLAGDAPIAIPPPEAKEDPKAAAAVADAQLTDLLTKMLTKNAKDRMLLGGAVHHPFFQLDSATAKRLVHPSSSISPSTTASRRPTTTLTHTGIGSTHGGEGIVVTASAAPGTPSLTPHHSQGPWRRLSPAVLNPSRLSTPGQPSPMGGTASPNSTTQHPSAPAPGGGANGGGATQPMVRRSLVSYSGSEGTPAAGSGLATPTTAAHARKEHLFEKALQEVKRGKNLTEAFYGVKSIRRVRRKDVKNADTNANNDHDDASSAGQMGNSQSLGDGGTSPNSRSSGVSQDGPTPRKASRFPQANNHSALPPCAPTTAGTSAGNVGRLSWPSTHSAGTPVAPDTAVPPLSQSSLSDAAFDMATIKDAVAQQREDGSSSLELVRLKMRSAPAVVNSVADITTSLRFSMNSLFSVGAVRFDQFALLKDITITSNQLRRFPEEVLKAPRLLRLDLSHNCITTVPPSLIKARFLERLNLHGNNIRAVGVDPLTHTSVLAAPSLRHVRLSSNPIEALPRNLESTQGIELVLDANPTVMREWYAKVSDETQRGSALPAVVIWDDYFPVRVPGCAFDLWIATGDLSLYRAHTLKACDTPYVVLLSAADNRFPRGGSMSAEDLAAYLEANAGTKRIDAGGKGGGPYAAVSQPPPRPLPPIISKESRKFVKRYFFVSDDIEDPYGGYNALLDFLANILVEQREIFAEKGIRIGEDTAVVVPLNDATNAFASDAAAAGGGSSTTRRRASLEHPRNAPMDNAPGHPGTVSAPPARSRHPDSNNAPHEAEDAAPGEEEGLRPNSGKGIMLVLMNTSAVRDARETTVAALSDCLCRMSDGHTEDQLKIMFDAVMEAMRSLYA